MTATLFAMALAALYPGAADATGWKRAKGIGKPPAEGDCRNYPGQPCINTARRSDFHLDKHILHVGETVGGSGKIGWTEWSPDWTGPGLKLLHRHRGKQSFSATWKATGATSATGYYDSGGHLHHTRWQTGGPGFTLSVPGSAVFSVSDYYAVVDKRTGVIEGTIKDLDGAGVGGLQVLIRGTGGRTKGKKYYATTGADGYYQAIVAWGHYRICPRWINSKGKPFTRGRKCDRGNFKPEAHGVEVRPRTKRKIVKTVEADFTYQGGTKLKIVLGSQSAPADGTEMVSGKIETFDRWGKPLPSAPIEVWPNQRGSDQANLSPPALVCDTQTNQREWPDPNPIQDAPGTTLPFDATTDAHGHYDFAVFGGTVPGTWKISALIQNEKSPDAFDEQRIAFTAQAATPYATLHERVSELRAAGGQPQLPSFGSDANRGAVLAWLTALRQEPWWQGVEFAPIDTGTPGANPAVLLYPQSSPPTVAPGGVTDGADARVIEATTASNVVAAMGGNPQTLPLNLTFGEWLQGIGVNPREPALLPPASQRGNGLTYFGFPYPTAQETATCH